MKILICSILLNMIFSTLSYAYVKKAKCEITSDGKTKEITLGVGHIDIQNAPSLIIFKNSKGQEDIVIYLKIIYNGELDLDPEYYNNTKKKYSLSITISKSSSKMKGVGNNVALSYSSASFPIYGIIDGSFTNSSPLEVFDQYQIDFSCKPKSAS